MQTQINPIRPTIKANIKDSRKFLFTKCQYNIKGKTPQIKPNGVLMWAGKGSLLGHKLLWQFLHFNTKLLRPPNNSHFSGCFSPQIGQMYGFSIIIQMLFSSNILYLLL